MKRWFKMVQCFLLVLAVWTVCLPVTVKAASSFVQTSGTQFVLNNQPFYFAGTNNYYFHYKSKKMVDAVFDDMKAMNLKVIRIWGFHDGTPQENSVLQSSPGVYEESGFRKLDYAIHKAGQEGIKLVIPLVNNWDDFGGMNQYVKWFQAGTHDNFYTDDQIKQAYKNYVRYVLERTNTYTGVQYKNDPAIMTWELANEPRVQSDPTGDILVNWANEMSSFINSIDRHHLVAVGDEGFFHIEGHEDWFYRGGEGVDWDRLTALPNIDYGTYHLYPDHWNKSAAWGVKWIEEHITRGKAIGKPVVLEEFGYQNQSDRDEVYRSWLATVDRLGGAGSQFWLLTSIQDDDTLYPDYDGFRIIKQSSTASLISEHAKRMNEKN
ncbi:cellulase family glycosylhydrolase [Bacillus sp. NPDC093026]|uniref:glycoside hydrolase 5 family protein n=1 Tax=Bacillus sp. NPDC093026 TaxID=3363948 RepID=UPI0037FBFC4D